MFSKSLYFLISSEFSELYKDDVVILDSRSPQDFSKGFIKGSINIGLKGQYAPWVGVILSPESPLLLIADKGFEREAITRLARVGYENVIGFLDGGVDSYEGNLEVIKQNEINTNGSYYKKRNIGDEIINWNSSSRQIFNFIRAISHPGPCARTYINNIEYMIEKAVEQNIDNKSLENIIYHVPGTIVEVEDNQIKVKTANSFILITKFRSVEKSHYKIKINDKFSNKVEI